MWLLQTGFGVYSAIHGCVEGVGNRGNAYLLRALLSDHGYGYEHDLVSQFDTHNMDKLFLLRAYIPREPFPSQRHSSHKLIVFSLNVFLVLPY